MEKRRLELILQARDPEYAAAQEAKEREQAQKQSWIKAMGCLGGAGPLSSMKSTTTMMMLLSRNEIRAARSATPRSKAS